jgi:acyl dehydratase
MKRRFKPVEQTYSSRDSILYALALGFGSDPGDELELPFVYEAAQKAAPTLPLVLGSPGFWLDAPDVGIDWRRAVHSGHKLTIHSAVPTAGRVMGETRISGIVDLGQGKGALLLTERLVHAADTGALIASMASTTLCRGEGGFGGAGDSAPPLMEPPSGPPDIQCDLATNCRLPILYRLFGDRNPIHIEPGAARSAGFPRPIMHGLASLGLAGRAILRAVCRYDTSLINCIEGRFTAPLFPGETLRVEMWRRGRSIAFQALARERNVVVLANGLAQMAANSPMLALR